MMKRRLRIFLLAVLVGQGCFALPGLDLNNKASLQRGAALFINYCAGCHSLKYLRYEQLAQDLAIPSELVKNKLIFTQAALNAPILNALAPNDAQEWFGAVPPDLSLIARQRGDEWLYRYLTGFYRDNSRPFGVNNHMLANVAMPDVLANAFHEQELGELINFLNYVGEPRALFRRHLGPYVLLFFMLFFIPVYYLKRLYW